jgi:sugar/nucleoside kinase (ribokinase family)
MSGPDRGRAQGGSALRGAGRARPMIDVVCLGILVADAIARPVGSLPPRGELALVEEISLRGGGCALSTASALTRLGLQAAVAGKVGADPFGDFLLRLLDERGIDRRGVLRDPQVSTSATVVLVAPDGERSFLHVPGASGRLRAEELDGELVLSGRALHVGGALVMPELDGEPIAALLAEARSRGILTSLDTAFDATGRWQRVIPCLPHLDLFMPSLIEAQALSGEREPAAVSGWLRAHGVREVALTMGDQGCYAVGDGFQGQVAPLDVRAIDSTGAGDAFAGGLLYGKLTGRPFEEAVRLANAVGALATTAVGAAEGLRDLHETLALAGLE